MLSYSGLIQKLKGFVALKPQSVSGSAAVDGAIINRTGFRTGKLDVAFAAASGSPSGATLNIAVLTSDSSSMVGATTLFQLETALSVAADGLSQYNMILDGALEYIQVVVTPTFTGGTSPASIVSASLQLGDADNEPADSSNLTVWGS